MRANTASSARRSSTPVGQIEPKRVESSQLSQKLLFANGDKVNSISQEPNLDKLQRFIDNQEIPGITGGALDSNEGEPGPLMLQGDHGQVAFRNVIITPAKE